MCLFDLDLNFEDQLWHPPAQGGRDGMQPIFFADIPLIVEYIDGLAAGSPMA
jgi:hypothetical protein